MPRILPLSHVALDSVALWYGYNHRFPALSVTFNATERMHQDIEASWKIGRQREDTSAVADPGRRPGGLNSPPSSSLTYN
ncbi:hypothetical protein E2C01_033168 [Portunus trituberculatus]|uniref:Uncharacterized protein n=1 Tax=Portunus trituberculatus TaxID=210409 RepID=A0A5B7F3H9_PORTR|nr:hypothetical protein [Portunus trituberculatus]